jgi:hypothetical protein
MFVVPDATRARNVERVIAHQPDSARSLFAVATEVGAAERLADPDQAGAQPGEREVAA